MGEGASFVWPVGDSVKTSRSVVLPASEVRVALRAWALGHDMRAFRIGPYAVVKYQGDVIQIGCHRIPRRNLVALYEVMTGKKFKEPAS